MSEPPHNRRSGHSPKGQDAPTAQEMLSRVGLDKRLEAARAKRIAVLAKREGNAQTPRSGAMNPLAAAKKPKAAPGGTRTKAAPGGTRTKAAPGGTRTKAAPGGTRAKAAPGGTRTKAAPGGTRAEAQSPQPEVKNPPEPPRGPAKDAGYAASEGAAVETGRAQTADAQTANAHTADARTAEARPSAPLFASNRAAPSAPQDVDRLRSSQTGAKGEDVAATSFYGAYKARRAAMPVSVVIAISLAAGALLGIVIVALVGGGSDEVAAISPSAQLEAPAVDRGGAEPDGADRGGVERGGAEPDGVEQDGARTGRLDLTGSQTVEQARTDISARLTPETMPETTPEIIITPEIMPGTMQGTARDATASAGLSDPVSPSGTPVAAAPDVAGSNIVTPALFSAQSVGSVLTDVTMPLSAMAAPGEAWKQHISELISAPRLTPARMTSKDSAPVPPVLGAFATRSDIRLITQLAELTFSESTPEGPVFTLPGVNIPAPRHTSEVQVGDTRAGQTRADVIFANPPAAVLSVAADAAPSAPLDRAEGFDLTLTASILSLPFPTVDIAPSLAGALTAEVAVAQRGLGFSTLPDGLARSTEPVVTPPLSQSIGFALLTAIPDLALPLRQVAADAPVPARVPAPVQSARQPVQLAALGTVSADVPHLIAAPFLDAAPARAVFEIKPGFASPEDNAVLDLTLSDAGFAGRPGLSYKPLMTVTDQAPVPVTAPAHAWLPLIVPVALSTATGPDAASQARGALSLPGVEADKPPLQQAVAAHVLGFASLIRAPGDLPQVIPSPGIRSIDTALARSGLTVRLHVPSGLSEQVVSEASLVLRRRGLNVPPARQVSFTISENHVRFYDANDAEMAGKIAQTLGGIARDFTTYRPKPRTRLVEIWLAGTPAGNDTRTVTRSRPDTRRSNDTSIEAIWRKQRDLLKSLFN